MSKPLHNFELTSWTSTRSVISRNQHRGRRPVKPAADAGANAGGPQLEQCPPPDTTQLQKLCLSVCTFEAQKERKELDRREGKFSSASSVAAKKGKEAAAAVVAANEEYLEIKPMVSVGEDQKQEAKKKRVPEEGKKVVEKPKIPQGTEKQESKGKRNKLMESRAMENDSTQKSMNVRSQDPTEKKNTRGKSGSTSGPKVDWTSEKFPVSLSREEIEEDFLFMTGRMPPRRPKRRVKKVQEAIDGRYKVSLPHSVYVDTYRVIEEPEPEEFW